MNVEEEWSQACEWLKPVGDARVEPVRTFMDRCVDFEIPIPTMDTEVIRYIELWHTGCSQEPLYTFLGMSRDEYRRWVQDSRVLSDIVIQRQKGHIP
jgi:hypothetical protein